MPTTTFWSSKQKFSGRNINFRQKEGYQIFERNFCEKNFSFVREKSEKKFSENVDMSRRSPKSTSTKIGTWIESIGTETLRECGMSNFLKLKMRF